MNVCSFRAQGIVSADGCILTCIASIPGGGVSIDTPAGFIRDIPFSSRSRCSAESFEASSSPASAALSPEAPVPARERPTSTPKQFACVPAHAVSAGLGCLCKTCLRRTGSSAALSRPIHAPGRHQQPSTARVRRRTGGLSVEGLRPRQQTAKDDADRRRIPPALRRDILPRGFVRIRQYGFLANRCRASRLTLARQLLTAGPISRAPCPGNSDEPASWKCPRCGAIMQIGRNLTARQLASRCTYFDSS